MSQYPMYPSTQLSYLPAACTTPMYTYPANYMAMLPAMYGNGMTAGNMVQQQQQHPQQTVSPQAVVTGNTSLVDDNSQSKDSRETVTVSSSVSDNAGAPDNVSTVSDDRTEYIEELSREKEILEQKDNCHARRLIDRGKLSMLVNNCFMVVILVVLACSNILLICRDFSGTVRGCQRSQQLWDPDGGRLQGEAHQAGRQSHRPRQGASQGIEPTFMQNVSTIWNISLSFQHFVIALWHDAFNCLFQKMNLLQKNEKSIIYQSCTF